MDSDLQLLLELRNVYSNGKYSNALVDKMHEKYLNEYSKTVSLETFRKAFDRFISQKRWNFEENLPFYLTHIDSLVQFQIRCDFSEAFKPHNFMSDDEFFEMFRDHWMKIVAVRPDLGIPPGSMTKACRR